MNPDFAQASLGLTPRAAEPAPAAPAGTPTFEQLFPAEHGRLAAAESRLASLEPRLAGLEEFAARAEQLVAKAAESRGFAAVLKMAGIDL